MRCGGGYYEQEGSGRWGTSVRPECGARALGRQAGVRAGGRLWAVLKGRAGGFVGRFTAPLAI